MESRAVPVSKTVGIRVRGSVKCDHSMALSESVQLTGFDSSSCLLEDADDHDGHLMVGVRILKVATKNGT